MPTVNLSKKQAHFWETIYTRGLGEFYFKNKIDFHNLVHFPYSDSISLTPDLSKHQDRSLVGIGGRKDSIVTVELLKRANKQITGFILNPHPIQENISKLLEIDSISMSRVLDPQLFELNKRQDAYNGHVPISTIYAFTAILGAVLYDYRYIIVSNEKSANYGNVEYLGETVNHQWSKSEEFEKLMQDYVKSFISQDIVYFSLLRPFYEVKIVELFSHYEKYFSTFSSCNTNFKLNSVSTKLWCGQCAKCAFAFSLLAAFLPKDNVVKIFGKNLYEDGSLLELYRELLGIKDIKPFDCVGTPDEVKLSFIKAYKKGEYHNEPIMKLFETDVLPGITNEENLESNLMGASNFGGIPQSFEETILNL